MSSTNKQTKLVKLALFDLKSKWNLKFVVFELVVGSGEQGTDQNLRK